MKKKLSFFQKLWFLVNILCSFALFLACIVPFTSSASLAFLSLGVPALVLANSLFLGYWIFKFRKQFLLSFFVLVFGYLTIGSFMAFSDDSEKVVVEDSISILSFNSLGFRGKQDEWRSKAGDTIVDFIKSQNPDILCFQEFDYRKIRTDHFKDYPYRYVDFEFGVHTGRVVQAVYSKYEIINKALIDFPNSSNSAIYTDILVHKDTIRVYNVHLQSLNIRPSNLKKERSDKLFSRLRASFAKQQEQSDIVRKSMDKSPYRNIVCGDFNSTQFSKVYFNIKENYKDTFLEKGSGYGSTIHFWKFPFRIDFILTDPSMMVLSHKNFEIDLSDHEPIMASIKLSAN